MRYYTGVGSRDIPHDITNLIRRLSKSLCDRGWRVRSGGADGADTAFHLGAMESEKYFNVGMDVYLPWDGFNGRFRDTSGKNWQPVSFFDNYEEAKRIASEVHPAWERLGRGPRALHTRNVYQVLGNDLDTPSKALICWAQPVGSKGMVKGGTNTAVQLAIRYNIPVHNLFLPEARERALNLIQETCVA